MCANNQYWMMGIQIIPMPSKMKKFQPGVSPEGDCSIGRSHFFFKWIKFKKLLVAPLPEPLRTVRCTAERTCHGPTKLAKSSS